MGATSSPVLKETKAVVMVDAAELAGTVRRPQALSPDSLPAAGAFNVYCLTGSAVGLCTTVTAMGLRSRSKKVTSG
jgi:hypothetical protein